MRLLIAMQCDVLPSILVRSVTLGLKVGLLISFTSFFYNCRRCFIPFSTHLHTRHIFSFILSPWTSTVFQVAIQKKTNTDLQLFKQNGSCLLSVETIRMDF